MIVVWLFLAIPWVCLHFVIVVYPDHTHFFLHILEPRATMATGTRENLEGVIKLQAFVDDPLGSAIKLNADLS